MISRLLPRRRQRPTLRAATVLAAALAALAQAVPVAAQQEAGKAEAAHLLGRWSGNGFMAGQALPLERPRFTIDLAACGAGICGRRVHADGTCSAVIMEFGGAVTATDPATGGEAQFTGRLALDGRPPVAIAATLASQSASGPARLALREADRPLYSRRMPDQISLSLERVGPPACVPQRTS